MVGSHTTNTTNSINQDIDFGNQLFTFQTWKEDRFKNELSNESAAVVTAHAFSKAVFQTEHELKHQYGISKMQIEQHFIGVLKREFATFTNGGRVQIGNPYGLNPIPMEHNWFGYGDCN